MCLIIIAYRTDPDYPLIIAANRDESFVRPTDYARYWEDAPDILAGKDLEQGGSWFGVTKYGHIAAVTNYRDANKSIPGNISRGLLVSNYLSAQTSTEEYLDYCISNLNDYDGFNLLLGDIDNLYYLSNREVGYKRLEAGVYGLSNGDFDNNWPKVLRAKKMLINMIDRDGVGSHEPILSLLSDREFPEDAELPNTGIDAELERTLAPIFIKADGYGTRSSTALTISKEDEVKFTEQSFDSQGNIENTSQYKFVLVKQG